MKIKLAIIIMIICAGYQITYANGYEDALFHVNKGDYFFQREEYKEALVEYNKALDWNNGYGYAAYVHYKKALVYEQLKNKMEALKECKLSVGLFPSVNYKYVKSEFNLYNDAKVLLKKLSKLSPKEINKLKQDILKKVNNLLEKGDQNKLLDLLSYLKELEGSNY